MNQRLPSRRPGGSLEQAFALVLKMGRELSRQPMAPLMITEPIIVDPDDHVAKVAVTLLAVYWLR